MNDPLDDKLAEWMAAHRGCGGATSEIDFVGDDGNQYDLLMILFSSSAEPQQTGRVLHLLAHALPLVFGRDGTLH